MSAAVDAIRNLITPLLSGWRVQVGRWYGDNPADRYAVIRPAGGGRAELVRRPQFVLSLIGADGDAITAAQDAADSIIQAMRASSGSVVSLDPAEPVFVPTSDGRAVFEIAISAITV
jgi:hypothetical protein